MFTEKNNSVVKETLKCICCSDGWCYGVFWGFDQINSLLLTLQDFYCEEQMGALVDDMLLQVHVLGGGEIGQAALSQNHRWIYSDAHHHHEIQEYSYAHECQHESDFFGQFTLGIKTIALISVEPWGVVQFGSTKKIRQKDEFADRVREWFKGTDATQELKHFEDEPPSHNKMNMINYSSTQFCSLFSSSQNFEDFEAGLIEQNDSLFGDQLLLDQSCHFVDSSILTPQMKETSAFLQPHNISFPSSHCEDRNPKPHGLQTLDELFRESDFSEDIVMDDLSQWCSSSPRAGSSCASMNNVPGLIPLPDLCRNEDTLIPLFNFETDTTKSISAKKNAGSRVPDASSSNSLFSQLGLDQLLTGNNNEACGSGFYAKRRKIDNYSWIHSQGKSRDFDGNYKDTSNTVCELKTKGSARIKSEASTEEQGSVITGDAKRQDKFTAKTGKKKAKPGTKPRPKDRQMIQDRLAELRQLIPNGEKISIDRLLERTIRHMNYMQSLTKHAEMLRQSECHKPKVHQQPSLSTSNGITWACEVGDRNTVCPLIVEDLAAQGQMLIEILYEERGFFLEIVNVIRSFGLTLLKGVMEDRETKTWARFIVESEGNRHVMRHEIFSSLIQLLQVAEQNATHGNDTNNNNNNITAGSSLFNNCQPSVSFPVNLGNAFASIRQCS